MNRICCGFTATTSKLAPFFASSQACFCQFFAFVVINLTTDIRPQHAYCQAAKFNTKFYPQIAQIFADRDNEAPSRKKLCDCRQSHKLNFRIAKRVWPDAAPNIPYRQCVRPVRGPFRPSQRPHFLNLRKSAESADKPKTLCAIFGFSSFCRWTYPITPTRATAKAANW